MVPPIQKWSWKQHSFNPEIQYVKKQKDCAKIIVIGYLTISVILLGSVLALIYGRSPNTYSTHPSLRLGKSEKAEENCRRIGTAGYDCTEPCLQVTDTFSDCTDRKTYEKSLLKPLHYIYAEQKTVWVTAYNSVEAQTDSSPCIGTDGTDICKAHNEGIQSCAGNFRFGTIITVPGWATCTIHDRMASNSRDRIDLYFGGADRIAAAKAWGKRKETITIFYKTPIFK